jgi:hypothetical protein
MTDEYGKVVELTAKVLEENGFVGIITNGYNRDWYKYNLKLETHGGYNEGVFVFCRIDKPEFRFPNEKRVYYLHELNGIDELYNGYDYKNLPDINKMSVDELTKLLLSDVTYTYNTDKRRKQKHTIGYSDGREQLFARNYENENELDFLKKIVARYILHKPTLK